MQIFISYSHNDSDQRVARYLTGRLRAAGMTVWQDESSHPAGDDLGPAIEDAIRASDRAIYIVSKLWLESRWCQLEVDRIDRVRDKLRPLPIFRLPPERLYLPMQLIGKTGITWLDDDSHDDARYWEVHCAMTGTEPGEKADWNAKGRALGAGTAEAPYATTAEAQEYGSLRCDRALQWNRVSDVEPEQSHDLLIVPGEIGQAHDHFSRRIRELLTRTPARNIFGVYWKKRPSSQNEYLAALAATLRVSEVTLARELLRLLDAGNVILIHPCLRSHYIDEALIGYYTNSLPTLLQTVKPQNAVKCVQPVEWPPAAGALSATLNAIGVTPETATDDDKASAEKFIARLGSSAATALRRIRLQDLANITDADIEEFCERERLEGAQKVWFLSRIKLRNPKNSAEVLEAIDANLADARSVT